MTYPLRSPRTSIPMAFKVITLWGVFLLGTLFHTQLALIPLFHGLSVTLHEEQAASLTEITPVLWLMLAFFMVPLISMISALFTESRRFCTIHFGITILYSVMNLAHLVADLMVTPIAWYQIVLMVWLLVVGLLLNIVAYQWRQEAIAHHHKLQSL